MVSMLKPPLLTNSKLISFLHDHERRRAQNLLSSSPSLVFLGQKSIDYSRIFSNNNNKSRIFGGRTSSSLNTANGLFGSSPQSSSQFSSHSHGFVPCTNNTSNLVRQTGFTSLVCQICNKPDHGDLKCWHHFNLTINTLRFPLFFKK